MKIVSIVGARPQFVKVAPVSRELRTKHQEILVHTGQHYDYLMSQAFFEELDIQQPDYNLGVGSASHGEQTGKMLARLEEVLVNARPDIVLVYGDTNSTLAGALAAAKLHIPVAHVEAGLRSFNRLMPEEINRVLTDHISTLLFCPTETAVKNLMMEGIRNGVHNVGDVMYDAVLHYSEMAERKSNILKTLGIQTRQYVLVTVHRPSNTDDSDNLKNIMAALNDLKETVVFPTHPRVRKAMEQLKIQTKSHVLLTEPVRYLDMLMLEKNARIILTDSGGVQKEAYYFGVPCITLREETEWLETVSDGWNVLVGADTRAIIEQIHKFQPKTMRTQSFGDGHASKGLVEILNKYCK